MTLCGANGYKPCIIMGDLNARTGSLTPVSQIAMDLKQESIDEGAIICCGRKLVRHCSDNKMVLLNGTKV